MSTNLTKWDDTGNELTAFCNDDTGDTEIGPAKWDDTNNRLEINCNSTDFQVKWNDATNKLEAQGVDSDCCYECETPCNECPDNCGPPCFLVEWYNALNPSTVYTEIAYYAGDCCWLWDSTVILKYEEGEWKAWASQYLGCDFEITQSENINFDCENGGVIQTTTSPGYLVFTFTPCEDCDDCPPA